MIRAAAYARVSTDEQAERQTPIEDQLARARDFARERGWTIEREYVDAGISGALGPEKRPGLQEVLDDAGRNWETLLIWDESRLARDVDLAGHLRYLLRSAAVSTVCVSSPDASRLEGNIRRVLADEQRERLRQDVIRGMRAIQARQGKMGSRSMPGYRWVGLRKDARLEIEPIGAAWVREVFADALEGVGMSEICRKHGIRATLRLRFILRHPVYAGGYLIGYNRPWKDREIVWGHHAPIIPREEWDRVQARLDDQSGASTNPRGIGRHPLSGLLRCALCGRALTMTAQDELKSAGLVYWYRCPNHPQAVKRRIPESWTAELLAEVLRYLDSPELHQAIADALTRAHRAGERTGMEKREIRQLEATIRRLEESIADPGIPDTRGLRRRLADAQTSLKAVRGRLAASKRRSGLVLSPSSVGAILHGTSAGSGRIPSREVLRSLLERIDVGQADPVRAVVAGSVLPISDRSPVLEYLSRVMSLPVWIRRAA